MVKQYCVAYIDVLKVQLAAREVMINQPNHQLAYANTNNIYRMEINAVTFNVRITHTVSS